MRCRIAIDPEAVLDGEPAAAAAELPHGRAADAEQGALPVGRRRHFDRRGEVEADRERHIATAPAPARGNEHVLPRQLAAVGGKLELALVVEAEAAGIAVVARFPPGDAPPPVARPLPPDPAPAPRARVGGGPRGAGAPRQ